MDEHGYEIDSDDDDERVDDAMAAAAELNPYANVRIESESAPWSMATIADSTGILAPLTASTDLPTHVTLSKPFTSRTLTDLVDQACMMMRKENHSLWQVRHLWTTFCGDRTWAPCETMVGPRDIEMFSDDHVAQQLLGLSRPHDASLGQNTNGVTGGDGVADGAKDEKRDQDLPMAGVPNTDGPSDVEHRRHAGSPARSEPPSDDLLAARKDADAKAEDTAMTNGQTPSKGSPDRDPDSEPPFIHPIFSMPANSIPDRNFGLTETEADHFRRLLTLYMQKQEEICRGIRRLHQGLLRAERLRHEVLRWSKAEAHTDLSDGEDWYDRDEWGLAEDLKKGQDEEEEDTTATTGKKTRARR